ncbi:MAG: hypothetical protein ACK50Q_15050 [Labrys sp. (in: a-proteobacteria)]
MPEVSASRYMTNAGWDDVPHLDERAKRELLDATPAYMRDARSKGTPSLGAGAIYPFPESEITVPPFAIPAYWPRCYGLDVGWNRTAAVWIARDENNDTAYLYTEHYQSQAHPSVHASAIRARGDWIPGVIDPAARGRQQRDGEQLLANYSALGLNLFLADNAINAGLWECEQRFGTGRLKIFSTCANTIAEYRLYRRDERGNIVKKFDHAMDAMRYAALSGIPLARKAPLILDRSQQRPSGPGDPLTGY